MRYSPLCCVGWLSGPKPVITMMDALQSLKYGICPRVLPKVCTKFILGRNRDEFQSNSPFSSPCSTNLWRHLEQAAHASCMLCYAHSWEGVSSCLHARGLRPTVAAPECSDIMGVFLPRAGSLSIREVETLGGGARRGAWPKHRL